MLHVQDLQVFFATGEGCVPALNSVSFSLPEEGRLAVIGESGCGKTVMALAVMGLLPRQAMVRGNVFYNDIDLMVTPERLLAELRGRETVLVPQDPLSHLNPVFSVGAQAAESVRRCGVSRKRRVRERVLELLELVGFTNPAEIFRSYPHELSGGMAQRVILAIGLAGKPRLVIADEPTRGLDTAARESYLALIKKLYKRSALLVITHDLEVAASCDHIMVMYAGEVVESGPLETVLAEPLHPYTAGLLAALPESGMKPIAGQTPGLAELPAGCRFHPRCDRAVDICRSSHPDLGFMDGRAVRCFKC